MHFAAFAQSLRKAGSRAQLYSDHWAMADETISNGGRAVEGAYFCSPIPPSGNIDEGRPFVKKFHDRFQVFPGYNAHKSWEAIMALAMALRSTDPEDPVAVKRYLLSKDGFAGVDGTFRWNNYGDIIRPIYLLEVQNGQYVDVTRSGMHDAEID